jgi:hypothetical protein
LIGRAIQIVAAESYLYLSFFAQSFTKFVYGTTYITLPNEIAHSSTASQIGPGCYKISHGLETISDLIKDTKDSLRTRPVSKVLLIKKIEPKLSANCKTVLT